MLEKSLDSLLCSSGHDIMPSGTAPSTGRTTLPTRPATWHIWHWCMLMSQGVHFKVKQPCAASLRLFYHFGCFTWWLAGVKRNPPSDVWSSWCYSRCSCTACGAWLWKQSKTNPWHTMCTCHPFPQESRGCINLDICGWYRFGLHYKEKLTKESSFCSLRRMDASLCMLLSIIFSVTQCNHLGVARLLWGAQLGACLSLWDTGSMQLNCRFEILSQRVKWAARVRQNAQVAQLVHAAHACVSPAWKSRSKAIAKWICFSNWSLFSLCQLSLYVAFPAYIVAWLPSFGEKMLYSAGSLGRTYCLTGLTPWTCLQGSGWPLNCPKVHCRWRICHFTRNCIVAEHSPSEPRFVACRLGLQAACATGKAAKRQSKPTPLLAKLKWLSDFVSALCFQQITVESPHACFRVASLKHRERTGGMRRFSPPA